MDINEKLGANRWRHTYVRGSAKDPPQTRLDRRIRHMRLPAPKAAAILGVSVCTLRSYRYGHRPTPKWALISLAIYSRLSRRQGGNRE